MTRASALTSQPSGRLEVGARRQPADLTSLLSACQIGRQIRAANFKASGVFDSVSFGSSGGGGGSQDLPASLGELTIIGAGAFFDLRALFVFGAAAAADRAVCSPRARFGFTLSAC